MRLKNRQKNNYFDVSLSIMRGTIEMSAEEWEECSLYLKKRLEKATKNIETYVRDGLNTTKHFWSDTKKKKKDMFCVGVMATRIIVKQYNLKNYKDVNYAIIIK